MPPYMRSDEELRQELCEQLEALRSSASAYDEGKLWEAKRLATVAYILVHDGGRNSRSLLKQLNLKGQFLSTAIYESSPLPLAIINIAPFKGATYAPFLEEHSKVKSWLPFIRWYEEKIFVSGHLSLSRKNLIFTLRSQVGGAHVDPTIRDEAFHYLRTEGPISLSVSDPVGPEPSTPLPPEFEGMFSNVNGPVPNGPLATMRQIAWEIDQTLGRAGW